MQIRFPLVVTFFNRHGIVCRLTFRLVDKVKLKLVLQIMHKNHIRYVRFSYLIAIQLFLAFNETALGNPAYYLQNNSELLHFFHRVWITVNIAVT